MAAIWRVHASVTEGAQTAAPGMIQSWCYMLESKLLTGSVECVKNYEAAVAVLCSCCLKVVHWKGCGKLAVHLQQRGRFGSMFGAHAKLTHAQQPANRLQLLQGR